MAPKLTPIAKQQQDTSDLAQATTPKSKSQIRRESISPKRTVAEARSVNAAKGKLTKYSSRSTRFSPAHAPLDKDRVEQLAERLHTPDTLRRRTFVDFQQRRRKQEQTTYDAVSDVHLSHYWLRQHQLKEAKATLQNEKAEAVETLLRGEMPMKRKKSLSCMVLSTSPNAPPTRPTTQESMARKLSAEEYSSDDDFSDDGSSTQSSQPSWSGKPRSDNPSGSAPDPDLEDSKAGQQPAVSPIPRSASSPSDSRSSYSSSRSSRSVSPTASSPDQTPRSTPFASPEASPQKDSGESPLVTTEPPPSATSPMQRDRPPSGSDNGLGDSKTNRNSRSIRFCDDDVRRPSTASLPFARSTSDDSQSGQERERPRPMSEIGTLAVSTEVVPHDASLVSIAPPVHSILRQDLTSLWFIAAPPPNYGSGVRRLGDTLDTQGFDLNWLTEEDGEPAPGHTVLEIAEEVGETAEEVEFQLQSPRSIVAVLRNGVTLADLVPRPLEYYYHTGGLQGLNEHLCEKRFVAHDKRRRGTLRKVRADYASICSQASQTHVIKILRSINPNENPDFPVRFDHMEIKDARKGSRSLSRKLSIISRANDERTRKAMERADRQQSKHNEHLKRNVDRAKQHAQWSKEFEERGLRRKAELEEFNRIEGEKRRRRKEEKEQKLRDIVAEGKNRADFKRHMILSKLADQEARWDHLQRTRRYESRVTAEENRIQQAEKRDNMERRERLMEYQKLQTLDKIRRKLDKSFAAEAAEKATTKLLRQRREENGVAMRRAIKENDAEVLAYQRKHMKSF